MPYVLINQDTKRLQAKLSFRTQRMAEDYLEENGWRRDGSVWVGPSTGSRVLIVDKKSLKQGAQP